MQDSAIWQFSLNALHAAGWGGSLLVALVVFARYLRLRTLVMATTVVTLALVMLGAYVRLTDAGLGCPDWPGCYGKLSPKHAAAEIRAAEAVAPVGPVSLPKAWNEMLHRYVASLVGVMIMAIAWQTLRRRRRHNPGADDPSAGIGLPLAMVGLVIAQGLFGKWTVTLLLRPAIVTLHLLGGMALVALLAWLTARHLEISGGQPSTLRAIRPWVVLGLVILAVQISLGGWVSTNYAGLACVDFPTCHGEWAPAMDFGQGFHFSRELGMTADGEALSNQALNAIHWAHRVGALVTFAYLAILAHSAMRLRGLRRFGIGVLVLLLIQVMLGIANVLASLPLPLAVAHNGVAALLLAALMMLNFAAYSPDSQR
ncbi:MAG TPA: COX15/CtaA family protein [Burkholderiales bacterium]|nr:COX15/CtaA family protein [Burkholderiales bacterium]